MKAKIEIELKPFNIPNFAIAERHEPGDDERSFPLALIDANTLDRMCEDFRNAVFKKAGKQQPPMEAQRPHDHKSPRCWCGEPNYGAQQATSSAVKT